MSSENKRPEFVTMRQLAERLNVSVPTLKARLRELGLTGVRIGPRTVRFRADEVEQWLKTAK